MRVKIKILMAAALLTLSVLPGKAQDVYGKASHSFKTVTAELEEQNPFFGISEADIDRMVAEARKWKIEMPAQEKKPLLKEIRQRTPNEQTLTKPRVKVNYNRVAQSNMVVNTYRLRRMQIHQEHVDDAVRRSEQNNAATIGVAREEVQRRIEEGKSFIGATNSGNEILKQRGFRGNYIVASVEKESGNKMKLDPLDGLLPLERSIEELIAQYEEDESGLTEEEFSRLDAYLTEEVRKIEIRRQQFIEAARANGINESKIDSSVEILFPKSIS